MRTFDFKPSRFVQKLISLTACLGMLILFQFSLTAQTATINVHRNVVWSNIPGIPNGQVGPITFTNFYTSPVISVEAVQGTFRVDAGEGIGVSAVPHAAQNCQPANKRINDGEQLIFRSTVPGYGFTAVSFSSPASTTGTMILFQNGVERARVRIVVGPSAASYSFSQYGFGGVFDQVTFEGILGTCGYAVRYPVFTYAPMPNPGITVGGCTFAQTSWPTDLDNIFDIVPVTFRVFSKVHYLVVGYRTDGSIGAWEIDTVRCTFRPLDGGSELRNMVTYGFQARFGWRWEIDSVARDGSKVFINAINDNGQVLTRNQCFVQRVPNILPNTIVPVSYNFMNPGNPFYGRILHKTFNYECDVNRFGCEGGYVTGCKPNTVNIGNCVFALSNLPVDLDSIVDIKPVTFRSFGQVHYLIAGRMTNGRPGAWEVDTVQCLIRGLRGGTELKNFAHSGLQYNRGWEWFVTGIAADGSKIFLNAVNANGHTPTSGQCVAAGAPPVLAGTIVPISFSLDHPGNPFYGRVMWTVFAYECVVSSVNCSNGYVVRCARLPILSRLDENQISEESLLPARSEIQVYPNPVQNELFISSLHEGDRVEIYDISGKLIQFFTASENIERISTHDFQSGLYLVRIFQDAEVKTTRFVKR